MPQIFEFPFFLSWILDGKEYRSSQDRIILEAGESKINNTVLIIENVTLADRNDYKCKAKNDASQVGQPLAVGTAFVRVKSEWKPKSFSEQTHILTQNFTFAL